MVPLKKIEQKTVIVFNESESMAEIITYNRPMMARLDKLCDEQEEAVFLYAREEGERCYKVPKSWVTISTGPLTMEQRKKLAMNVNEVAALLGISRPRAYELTEIKGFPVIRLGSRKIIPVEAFQIWLKENTGKALL